VIYGQHIRLILPHKTFIYGIILRVTVQNKSHTEAEIKENIRKIYGMARPRVADTGDGLQIWRVPENM
jgi:hypothetical protein